MKMLKLLVFISFFSVIFQINLVNPLKLTETKSFLDNVLHPDKILNMIGSEAKHLAENLTHVQHMIREQASSHRGDEKSHFKLLEDGLGKSILELGKFNFPKANFPLISHHEVREHMTKNFKNVLKGIEDFIKHIKEDIQKNEGKLQRFIRAILDSIILTIRQIERNLHALTNIPKGHH